MQEPQPIIYLFLNKSLHMSVGKASAQAAHAVVMAMSLAEEDELEFWEDSAHRIIIVLEARDEQHMNNIQEYLLERDIDVSKIIDEGVNEIDPHTVTALATNILDKNDEHVIDTMSTFKLYRDPVKVTMEVER